MGYREEQMGNADPGFLADHSSRGFFEPEKPRVRHPKISSLPPGIKHLFWKVNFGGSHAAALSAALDKVKPESALVFVCPNARESTQVIVQELQDRGWSSSLALTRALFEDSARGRGRKARRSGRTKGWRSANKLQELSEMTREGSHAAQGYHWDAPVLVSAEEKVRGLHLDAVEAVFIVGLPKSASSYMHMAGRTGRLPHPFGQSVLVAHGRELTKVLQEFGATTGIKKWTHLGTGSPSRDGQEVMMRMNRQRQTGSLHKASDVPISGIRTTAGATLDNALWR